MLRVFSMAIAGLVLVAGSVLAAEHRGYLKSVDANKLTVTVEDKDKEKELTLKTDKATKYFGGKATLTLTDLNQMIKDSEGKGLRALIRTKGDGASEVVTEVRVAPKRRKGG